SLGSLALLLELGLWWQSGLEPVHLVAECVAPLAGAFLCQCELLVPEDARQEGRALGTGRVRQHRELLLAGEVGVEELVVRHAEHALQASRDFLQRVGDNDAVLVQLGIIEPALHAVRVAAESELELDTNRRARFRAQVADRVFVAARGGIAVNRPGDRLQQRRLAGAVGPDDAGDAVAEDDLGVGMLAEVHKPQPVQLHPVPPPVSLSARAAVSRYSTPSFTNVARFSSASRG